MSPIPVRRPARAVLAGGGLAGSLDILAAFAISASRGGSPFRVLQSIASGLIGPGAFQGGTTTAALGLALHFVIATGAALVYYLGSRRVPVLLQRPLMCGALYGIAVYIVMNFVVVPLSAVPKGPVQWGLVPILVLVHMVCVGMPIAFAVRRYTPSDTP